MLVLSISTMFCQVSRCGDKVCVTISEMDTLVYHELAYQAIKKDTAEYKSNIRSKNNQIALLRANEQDLKDQNKAQKLLSDNYKKSADDFQGMYNKESKKSKRRGSIIVGSVFVNILLILADVFFIKSLYL